MNSFLIIAAKPRKLNRETETCTLGLVEVDDSFGDNGGLCLGCASKRKWSTPWLANALCSRACLKRSQGFDHSYSRRAATPSQPRERSSKIRWRLWTTSRGCGERNGVYRVVERFLSGAMELD